MNFPSQNTDRLSSDLLTNQTCPVYRKWGTVLMLKAVKELLRFVHIHVKFDMTYKCQCWHIQYLNWKSTTHTLNTPGTLNWFSVMSTKVTESISSTSRFLRSLSIQLIIASRYIYIAVYTVVLVLDVACHLCFENCVTKCLKLKL